LSADGARDKKLISNHMLLCRFCHCL